MSSHHTERSMVTDEGNTFEGVAGESVGGLVVIGLGVLFGVVEVVHVREMSRFLGIVIEAILPLVGAVGLVVVGYLLRTGHPVFRGLSTDRIVGWIGIGMAGMAVIFLWTLSHQLIRGGPFPHAHFVLVNNLIAGGLVGTVIGTYDARGRAYRAAVDRERMKHEFLNRELRHHVLNGMNVVLGQTERLRGELDSSAETLLDRIEYHGTEIVDRVESVRTIASVFTETSDVTRDRIDLSSVLADSVEDVRDRYDHARFETDVPAGLYVMADELLGLMFENLLSNAVEHNDSETPTVEVSASGGANAVTVRIVDDGPGLPSERQGSLLAWPDTRGPKEGMGVGLAIVRVLIDRYGGRVHMNDVPGGSGTVVTVELPATDSA